MMHYEEVKPLPWRCRLCLRCKIHGVDNACYNCDYALDRFMLIKDKDESYNPMPLEEYEKLFALAVKAWEDIPYYGLNATEEERRKVWYAWKAADLLHVRTMVKGKALYPKMTVLEFYSREHRVPWSNDNE